MLMGVESQIAFTLPARPPMVLGIALSRGEEDFSDARPSCSATPAHI